MVAGTDRFDTRLMEILGERAFIKVGAEGVYCAALPELGYGIALKIDDGGTRAAEAAWARCFCVTSTSAMRSAGPSRRLAEPALETGTASKWVRYGPARTWRPAQTKGPAAL